MKFNTGTVNFRGETYQVREFSYGERSEFLKLRNDDSGRAMAFLAFTCAQNSEGTTPRFADFDSVANNEPAALVDTLCTKVIELSGVSANG